MKKPLDIVFRPCYKGFVSSTKLLMGLGLAL